MTSTVQTASAPFVEKAPLEAYVAPEKPSLVGLSREQLADALGAVGVPPAQRKMRVQQLWHWIYYRGSTSFDDMTTMSKDLRTALAERYTVARPEVVAEQVSVDGTRKWLLRLEGDADSKLPHDVECVYIPDTERGTLCVSSQVGCTLTCTFCHTGTQRLVRNLTAGEIAGQVLAARDRLGDWPGGTRPTDGVIPTGDRCVTNIVMMGMGEPLYNFDAVRDAILIMADGSNAKRITFEYVMLKDVNDSIEDAKALVRLLKGIPAKINLIPFNPWPGTKYECSDWDQIEKFSQVVFDAGYASPVRTPRGRDIFAACGQLKSATEKMSARERMALRAMAMVDE
jgi:23S rRNA (adenine2503-C2)-methyltransferase